MPDFPYHVVGGAFTASRRPMQFVESITSARCNETPISPSSSRRRKLWDIPHKFHCPVVGTCFDVGELRSLMKKLMHFPNDTSDFVLHTTAVGACESRGQLSEILQKQLEKRFTHTIRRFSAARDVSHLKSLWQQACQTGAEIPGALWATWTHPCCDSSLEHEVYGDIHMIQHQIGTGTRADLKVLQALRAENQDLRRQLEKASQENESLRAEKSGETQMLGQRIIELRTELAGRDAQFARLTGQFAQLRESLPDLKDRQSLLRRATDAEARSNALTASMSRLETEYQRVLVRLQQAEAALERFEDDTASIFDAPGIEAEALSATKLSGKCVLCVGGRSGAVDAYRQRIEQYGGRFLHHDGGLEENLHRIDSALAAADLVICQAGCISHNAYWRVKEQCKRTGKPCVFLRSPGVSSLQRVIEEAPPTNNESKRY
jgi:DNA repair exonuclease SbcCD ATPase subunit